VTDYSASQISTMASTIAAEAKTDASNVAVSIVSASVQITAIITATNGTSAAQIRNDLSTGNFASASAASTLLGITVTVAPTVTYARRFIAVGGGDDDDTALIVGLAVGIPGGLIVLGAIGMMMMRGKSDQVVSVKKGAPNGLESSTASAAPAQPSSMADA